MGSFWSTPDGRATLAARAMDRQVLNVARTAPESRLLRTLPDGITLRLRADGQVAQYGPGGDRLTEWRRLSPAELHVERDCSCRGQLYIDVAHYFHVECGYAWEAHDPANPAAALPFGCPSEADARAAWGDR